MNTKNTAKERLIIFTRYPEPGKTKTRLIPVLGAEGASEVQRQMTEHTLLQVKKLTSRVCVEIRFAGGDLTAMQNWLSSDIVYQPQGEGDLGAKMMRSLLSAFAEGSKYVVTIGSDCPGITAELIASAFDKLNIHDLVIGPAIDGGYYLIGVKTLIPELFTSINWGSAEVLQQTINIAQKLNLSITYLTPLADVDRPEDLPIWEDARNRD